MSNIGLYSTSDVELSNSNQQAADTGNVHGTNEGIKKALGPTSRKFAKSGILAYRQGSANGEHCSKLYSKQNIVTPSALDATVSLPPLDQLDAKPTMDKLIHAVKQLKPGKAPGNDSLPTQSAEALSFDSCCPLHHMTTRF